jgi:hypothetical protein
MLVNSAGLLVKQLKQNEVATMTLSMSELVVLIERKLTVAMLSCIICTQYTYTESVLVQIQVVVQVDDVMY